MKDIQETMPVLERFVVLISDHTTEVKESLMPETFCIFAQKRRTLETSCLLTMHYFSTPRELITKMDIVEDSALNGEHQGNHKSQMRGNLYSPPHCEHQRCN